MFLPEGPLVDTTNRERLQLITRENGKSLSKSNQHVRKAHYRAFLLLNVNDVNEILLINNPGGGGTAIYGLYRYVPL